MNKIDGFFRACFRSMDLGFLIKAYLISIVFTVFTFYAHISVSPVYTIICAVIFPFAYLLVNDVLSLLPFGYVFFMSFTEHIIVWVITTILKLVLYYFVYGLAVIFAPIGILYIALSKKYRDAADRWNNG